MYIYICIFDSPSTHTHTYIYIDGCILRYYINIYTDGWLDGQLQVTGLIVMKVDPVAQILEATC